MALITWCAHTQIPDSPFLLKDLILHIPNGGNRGIKEATRFKKMGVKRGVSDLFLPYPKHGYHGLWIELKAPIVPGSAKPTITKEQKEWIEKMTNLHYCAEVCYGWHEAREIIKHYIARPNHVESQAI